MSLKSKLEACENPCATALAQNLSKVPSAFLLVLNTYLLPTMFRHVGLLTRSNGLFFFSALISSFMAKVYCSLS